MSDNKHIYNGLLFQHLRVIEPNEFKRFEQFLQSPFCNEHPHPDRQVRLARHLYNASKADVPPSAAPGRLQRQVFGAADVAPGGLDKLMSATLKSLKKYLAVLQREAHLDPAEDDIWLASFYRERGLVQRFDKLVHEIDSELSTRAFTGEAWADARRRLEEEKTHQQALYAHAQGDLNLYNTLYAVDQAWLLRRLKYLMTLLHLRHQKPVMGEAKNNDWFEPAHPVFENTFYPSNHVLQLYALSVRLGLCTDSAAGDELCDSLLQSLDALGSGLPAEHRSAIEQHALLYCHREAYKGRDMAPLTHRIYRKQADEGRILLYGKLPSAIYISAVVAGLRAGEEYWVEAFIEKYRNYLPSDEHPDESYRLCCARLHFHRKQFQEALELIKGHFSNLTLNIFFRAFEIQILYDTGSPLFDARLESFKVFIHREKRISAEKKETYSRFANLLLQIRTSSNQLNPKRVEKLLDKVRRSDGIAERAWLLEKLEALKASPFV